MKKLNKFKFEKLKLVEKFGFLSLNFKILLFKLISALQVQLSNTTAKITPIKILL